MVARFSKLACKSCKRAGKKHDGRNITAVLQRSKRTAGKLVHTDHFVTVIRICKQLHVNSNDSGIFNFISHRNSLMGIWEGFLVVEGKSIHGL